MPPTYKQNKTHIYIYREKNKEKYNEYQRNLMFQKRNNPHFEFDKICKIFRNILF